MNSITQDQLESDIEADYKNTEYPLEAYHYWVGFFDGLSRAGAIDKDVLFHLKSINHRLCIEYRIQLGS